MKKEVIMTYKLSEKVIESMNGGAKEWNDLSEELKDDIEEAGYPVDAFEEKSYLGFTKDWLVGSGD